MSQITLNRDTPLSSLNIPSTITPRDIRQAVDTAARRIADDFVPAYQENFSSEGIMYASHAAFAFHQTLKERAVKYTEEKAMNQKDSFIVGAKAYTHIRANPSHDTKELLTMIPKTRRNTVETIELKMNTPDLIAELKIISQSFASVTTIDLSVKESKQMHLFYMEANKEISGGAPNPVHISYSTFVDALKAFSNLQVVKMANVIHDAAMDVGLRDKLRADLPKVTFSF